MGTLPLPSDKSPGPVFARQRIGAAVCLHGRLGGSAAPAPRLLARPASSQYPFAPLVIGRVRIAANVDDQQEFLFFTVFG